jgi:hypothetical protein
VYATLLEDDFVKIWFWPAASAPGDIHDEAPEPDLWGIPLVEYKSSSSCDVAQHWRKQTIVSCIARFRDTEALTDGTGHQYQLLWRQQRSPKMARRFSVHE